jgi:hypothetical protein
MGAMRHAAALVFACVLALGAAPSFAATAAGASDGQAVAAQDRGGGCAERLAPGAACATAGPSCLAAAASHIAHTFSGAAPTDVLPRLRPRPYRDPARAPDTAPPKPLLV